jgi:exodeoxyribonuclease VII small subunit
MTEKQKQQSLISAKEKLNMATKKKTDLSLEKMLERLDEISTKLDSDIPLETALSLYEEGVGLIKSANTLISEAEAKIRVLDIKNLNAEEPADE